MAFWSKKENSNGDDVARFTVSNATEIERVFRKMLADQTVVTLYADNGKDFVLTALVGLNMSTGYVYFDLGRDEGMNAVLFASVKSSAIAKMNQVRIQFVSGRLERAKYNGEIVFKAKLPRSILRFQRREFYRMATPMSEPAKCAFYLPKGTLKAAVADVSVGGIGVQYPTDGLQLEAGKTYDGCRLQLSGMPEISISLKVCSIFKTTTRSGATVLHAGCQFVKLPQVAEATIQRYIFKAERERKAHT